MFRATKELYTGRPLDFYARYTLDEVYQHLDWMSDRDYQNAHLLQRLQNLLKVRLTPINKQAFQFKASRDAGKGMWIIAEGTVYEDKSGVHVLGKVRLGWVTLIVCTIVTAIIVMASVPMIAVMLIAEDTLLLSFPVMMLFASCIQMLFLKQIQTELYNRIFEELTEFDKKKRSAI